MQFNAIFRIGNNYFHEETLSDPARHSSDLDTHPQYRLLRTEQKTILGGVSVRSVSGNMSLSWAVCAIL